MYPISQIPRTPYYRATRLKLNYIYVIITGLDYLIEEDTS